MKKQETFFQEELDRIQELIDVNDYDKALEKIMDVKQNHFWTMKQNDILDQLDSTVTKMYARSVNNENINKMTKKEIFNEALAKNKINLNLIDVLINKFGDKIDGEDIDLYIENWLNSKTIGNIDKYYVLAALKTINKFAKTKIKVYNSNLKKSIEIVLEEWDEDFRNIKYYQEVMNDIEKYFFKTPSYTKFAESIIDSISMWYFGIAPDIEQNKLSKNIIEYIEYLTQNKKINDIDFFKWVESILRKQEI